MEGSDATQANETEQEEVAPVEEQDTTGLRSLDQSDHQPISDAALGDPKTVTPQSMPGVPSGDPDSAATKAAQEGKPFAEGGPDSGNDE